nr:hypothetical protein [Clostridia bacterium]
MNMNNARTNQRKTAFSAGDFLCPSKNERFFQNFRWEPAGEKNEYVGNLQIVRENT